MGAAAAGVLLRRAIRRAFRAVCNLLVLLVLLILMLQDQLQGRVLQQIRHSAVRVLLLLSMLRNCRCVIRHSAMPASHPSRISSTHPASICIAHRSMAALHIAITLILLQKLSHVRTDTDVCHMPSLSITGAVQRVMKSLYCSVLLSVLNVLCRRQCCRSSCHRPVLRTRTTRIGTLSRGHPHLLLAFPLPYRPFPPPCLLLAYMPAPVLRWQDQAFKLCLSLHSRYAARPVHPRRPRCAIPVVTHARPPAPLQASTLYQAYVG